MRADRAGQCPVPGCVKHPRHIGRHLIRFATGDDEGVAFLSTIPEAGAARSDGAASGEARTRRRRTKRSVLPLAESASGEDSERTDETMSPRDDEGELPAGASVEERAGAASDNEHRCHVPGCIKQARHVGRHKVRLPDGGMPKGPYSCYARKLTSPERKTLRQRNGFLQADVESGIPSRLDAPPSHCPRPLKAPPPLPSPRSPPRPPPQPLTRAPRRVQKAAAAAWGLRALLSVRPLHGAQAGPRLRLRACYGLAARPGGLRAGGRSSVR